MAAADLHPHRRTAGHKLGRGDPPHDRVHVSGRRLSPPSPPPPPPDGERQISTLSGLNVLVGAWLIIAPWVLDYPTTDPRWNDILSGLVVGVFALIRASGAYHAEVLSWWNAMIGAWLVVAAFTIDQSTVASWNDAGAGIIVFILAIGSALATAHVSPGRRNSPPWGT